MTSSRLLNLAGCLPRSCANGPGTRMVLWVQGCPFRCPGCQNPDYLNYQLNYVVTVKQVWEIFKKTPDLDGISFSGGEPFAQAVALADLARLIQVHGKTVVCWTGYQLEQLQSSAIKGATDFLQHIDLLIDGPFIQEKKDSSVLRGSQNQKLHFLSNSITKQDLNNIPRQEWVITSEKLTYTGFPIQGEISV